MAESAPAPVVGGKKSAWMVHVKKTMKAHKGMKLGSALKLASKTFKKSKKGGAQSLSPATVGGRRRSRKHRSRKH